MIKQSLKAFSNLPYNTKEQIVQRKFENILMSIICTEINFEFTVDSERHFAVGGALVRGDLAIQGRSDTIFETLSRDFDIQAESYVSSSSKISRRPTRLLTCELKQEQSFKASKYWYRKSKGAQVLGATFSAFIDARLACIGYDVGDNKDAEPPCTSNPCVRKVGKQRGPLLVEN
jgi:hypothetical protein